MASAKTTTDHDEIRRWVEARGGYPAHVKRTGDDGDPGVLRIDYSGFSGAGTLERIDWDQFFEWFDRDKLAFLYQDERKSRFSKFVDRGSVKASRKRTTKKAAPKRTAAKSASGAKRSAAKKPTTAKKTTAAKKTSTAKKTSSAKKASPAKRSATKPRVRAAASPAKRPATRTSTKATSRSAKRTTSHNTIRRWVEARGGYPARVKRSGRGKDPGILRIDYPGFSGTKTLERIEWDEFFDWFDRDKLAFLYQDTPRSRFSKLVSR